MNIVNTQHCRKLPTRNNKKTMTRSAHSYFMTQALKVAKAALDVGEVPVGCVIVFPTPRGSTIVSHGANQANATRDAMQHSELIAIDRMLTRGMASYQL